MAHRLALTDRGTWRDDELVIVRLRRGVYAVAHPSGIDTASSLDAAVARLEQLGHRVGAIEAPTGWIERVSA